MSRYLEVSQIKSRMCPGMRVTSSPEPSTPVAMFNKNWHFGMGILNRDPECFLNHKIKSKQCAIYLNSLRKENGPQPLKKGLTR